MCLQNVITKNYHNVLLLLLLRLAVPGIFEYGTNTRALLAPIRRRLSGGGGITIRTRARACSVNRVQCFFFLLLITRPPPSDFETESNTRYYIMLYANTPSSRDMRPAYIDKDRVEAGVGGGRNGDGRLSGGKRFWHWRKIAFFSPTLFCVLRSFTRI